MKADWKKSTLGNVLSTLKNGLNCKQSKDGAGQKISRIESIATAYFDINRVGFSEISESDKAKFKLLKGDILFSHINSPIHVGKTATFNEDEDVYHGVNLLLMRPNEEVLPAYLELYLKSLFESGYWLKRCKQSVNQASVNQQDIAQVAIEFPSNVTEQHRIVTLLDEAFADIATAKANAEKNLQNARELFESHLQTLFAQRGEGWKDKTLEEISTTFGRGKSRHRPRNDPALYGGQYPFVQTGDVRNAEHIITEFSQTYSEAGLAQSKLWPKGTICITIAANIAETGILGFDACFPDSVIGVVPDPKEAEVGYVEYVLQSFKARLQALGQGSAQANINMGTFENERFPFPSVTEQRSIVTKLDALSEESQRLESIYRQKLTALDDLKKSLLHQAFSGQL